jgi:hypothetical protein
MIGFGFSLERQGADIKHIERKVVAIGLQDRGKHRSGLRILRRPRERRLTPEYGHTALRVNAMN